MPYQRQTVFSPMGATPPGIKWLLIINVVAFLLTPFLGNVLYRFLIFQPPYVFLVWTFITYMFLHGGFAHIFFNMFALWMFGRRLEYRWGTRGFLTFYLTCGVGAAVIHLLASAVGATVFGRPWAAVIGASGAIMGILVAYALLYGEETVYLYFVLPMKAKYFVLLLGILDAMASWGELTGSGQQSVAHFAHLGGLLTGYLYIKFGGRDGWRGLFSGRGPRMVRTRRVRRPYMEDDTWR